MSTNQKYNYEQYSYEEPAQRLHAIPQRKTKKSTNLWGVLILALLAYFIFLPALKNVYNYAFLNRIKNAKIKVNADSFYNSASKMFPNAHLLGRNLFVPAETKKNQMTQLKLGSEMQNLKNNLQYVINQYPNLQAGIFVWDYQTGNYVDINGEKQFSAASIIKVPILVEMFKRIEAGDLDLYEKFKMTSYYRTGGSGHLQFRPDGTTFEMETLAKYMIRISDNTATNMILSAIGGANEMDMALRNWGFSKTYIKTWLPDLYGTNVTTPKDMATILFNADNPDFLSLENRSKIVEIMSKVRNTSLLQQGIPDSARLIHKTGDIGEMLGDVGVVTMPDGRRYIITVMIQRRWNDYSARNLINSISSVTYNSFATNSL